MSSSALLKEHEKFAKRQAEAAAMLASTEKRMKTEKTSTQKVNRPKPTTVKSKTSAASMSDHHSSTGSTKRFKHLADIVLKLQERFQGGQNEPLTLNEIIKEGNFEIDQSDRHWLASEALLSNEKIDANKVDDEYKFVYKPPFDLKGSKRKATASLINLLKSRHEKCEGALTVDDVRDSIPGGKADIVIEDLIKSEEVKKVVSNKKEVLFYTDPEFNLHPHQAFVELWRKISVEALTDKQIEEYLDNQGHYGLKRNTLKSAQLPTKSKRGGRRADTMKHNQHVAHQLEDYSNLDKKK